jgi:hypothetical protein
MKRDMELIREILLAVEDSVQTQGTIDLQLSERAPEFVSYQVKCLAEAELIEATDLSSMHGFEWKPRSLTWQGHEFLDAARNDTVWKNAMSKLKGQATSSPLPSLV